MGTGIVAIASFYYSHYWPWLQNLATALWILNMLLFVVLIVPWVMRFFLYRQECCKDLRNPVTGQFFATMPIACLVLAADLLIIGGQHLDINHAVVLAKGFWLTGVVLAVLLAVITPLINIVSQDVKIEQINPAILR